MIFPFLDELCGRREIKAIGLGVPGIVEGGSYWKKRLGDEELYRVDIGHVLFERYKIPVVLENNLNAAAIGFEQCYEKEFPEEKPERADMAYLHFEKGCIGAGFIAGGRILRGHNNFAGEIGLIPSEDGKMWDDRMAETIDDMEYAKNVVQILNWICGILNPEYIALGGPDLRKDCIKSIGSLHSSMLAGQMAAEILYSEDMWHDYHNGMAFLTSGKMFDDIQFRKEQLWRHV